MNANNVFKILGSCRLAVVAGLGALWRSPAYCDLDPCPWAANRFHVLAAHRQQTTRED